MFIKILLKMKNKHKKLNNIYIQHTKIKFLIDSKKGKTISFKIMLINFIKKSMKRKLMKNKLKSYKIISISSMIKS